MFSIPTDWCEMQISQQTDMQLMDRGFLSLTDKFSFQTDPENWKLPLCSLNRILKKNWRKKITGKDQVRETFSCGKNISKFISLFHKNQLMTKTSKMCQSIWKDIHMINLVIKTKCKMHLDIMKKWKLFYSKKWKLF